jgi:TfoX/Sxy family transcriptional regulator of competence genes
MAYDINIENQIKDVVKDWPGIEAKRMFGGVGFLLHGNMLAAVYKESLILRLNETDFEEIKNHPGFHLFDITGRPMKGWALMTGNTLLPKEYKLWIEKARHFVQTLPA